MTFKLRSSVSIYAGQADIPPSVHEILVKERRLRRGDHIYTTGDVASDIEGKGFWHNANVVIQVIDDERLHIEWKKPWYYRWPVSFEGYWEDVIVQGREGINPLENDGYHHIDKYKLPEAFTLTDKIRIHLLVKERLAVLEGIKNVRRETEIVYEPTLPPQSIR